MLTIALIFGCILALAFFLWAFELISYKKLDEINGCKGCGSTTKPTLPKNITPREFDRKLPTNVLDYYANEEAKEQIATAAPIKETLPIGMQKDNTTLGKTNGHIINKELAEAYNRFWHDIQGN